MILKDSILWNNDMYFMFIQKKKLISTLFLKYENKPFKFCIIWYLLSHNLSKEPSTYSLSYKWEGKVQKRKKKRKLKKHHDTPISNVLWSSPSPPRETKLNTKRRRDYIYFKKPEILFNVPIMYKPKRKKNMTHQN